MTQTKGVFKDLRAIFLFHVECISCLKLSFLLFISSHLCPIWLFILLHLPPGDWPTGWKWAHSRTQSHLKNLPVSSCFPDFHCIFSIISQLLFTTLSVFLLSAVLFSNWFSHSSYKTVYNQWMNAAVFLMVIGFLRDVSMHCLRFLPAAVCRLL